MNIKYLNESFKRLYEAAIDEEPKTMPLEDELRKELTMARVRLQYQGATNIKQYEIAFQEVIENLFPDKSWWEITDCNIFFTLFETRSPELTIEQIIAELKPEYKKVEEFLDSDVSLNLSPSLSFGEAVSTKNKESKRDEYWNYIAKLADSYDGEAGEDMIGDEVAKAVGLPNGDYLGDYNDNAGHKKLSDQELFNLYSKLKSKYGNNLKEQLKECLNKLNEASISDEDKRDSDLIRSMMAKIERRSNARFTPEEEAVLDKYGIKRNNYLKSLDVDDISLDSPVDSENRDGYYIKYNNGNKAMINYADRARKIPQRKDNQAWGPRSRYMNSNDWVNSHKGYKRNPGERKGESPLVHAERTHQNSVMQEPIGQMRRAVQDRKFYQGMIDNSQSEYNKAIETARKNYDDAVRRATDTLAYRNTSNVHSRDRAQGEIDTLLKRKPKQD